uniref:Putative CRIB domain-containing protein RIC7-like isoform X1 n=1 Tax=Davidia involucrata TaxID=16924 RepID=A0A5B7BA01_DAVIN
MKGLLKGLRYISQIFDNEKEPEIQIGHPTDVKHVAHIGWDAPSASSPSWLNEFKTTSEPSASATKSSAKKEMKKSLGAQLDSPTRRSGSKTKQSRDNHSLTGSVGSPARDSSSSTKPRGHKNSLPDSPTHDLSNRSRRHQNSNLGSDSPSQDLPPKSKQSRRRKSRDSSDGGSTRSSRSSR